MPAEEKKQTKKKAGKPIGDPITQMVPLVN